MMSEKSHCCSPKDPLFGETFDGHLKELHFKKPSVVSPKDNPKNSTQPVLCIT